MNGVHIAQTRGDCVGEVENEWLVAVCSRQGVHALLHHVKVFFEQDEGARACSSPGVNRLVGVSHCCDDTVAVLPTLFFVLFSVLSAME